MRRMSSLEQRLLDIILSNLDRVLEFKRLDDAPREIEALREDPVFSYFIPWSRISSYVKAKIGGAYIVSLDRKLGDIYEECVKEIVKTKLGLSDEDMQYSYVLKVGGRETERKLDCKILLEDIQDKEARDRVERVIQQEAQHMLHPKQYRGIGLEIRFCYQIGDSKRIQADLDMAKSLESDNILPVMLIFCNISLQSPIKRFRERSPWHVKEGLEAYKFLKKLTGFDLYNFLKSYRKVIMDKVEAIFERLETVFK